MRLQPTAAVPVLVAIVLLAAPGCPDGGRARATPADTLEPPVQPPTGPAPAEPDTPAPPTPAPPTDQLRWEFWFEPSTMTMAQRGDCRMWIRVTNEGTEVATPSLVFSFTIDGEPSYTLPLAFNGILEHGWLGLPPGESVSTSRSPCEGHFVEPGDYTVGFHVGTTDLTAVIHIKP